MKISSASFSAGEMIPKKFSCDGPDASLKLNWTEPPAKTQSFALIMDDPDAPAGTWVHWVLFDLPADTRELAEGVAKQKQLTNGARQGRNDFGKIGYGGPCPPPGNPHRYFFKLYALDAKLSLKAGATKVYASCTHPVLSGPAVERIQNSEIVEVVVTNTIPLHSEARKCKKISVLSVGKLLAQAVQSIHEETSVSVLFI